MTTRGPELLGDDEPGKPLAERLKPLIEAHQGQVAVVVKHLDFGETFAYRPDEPMPTASLIKFPVMIEAYRQAVEGTVDLARTVVLRPEDKVPGSGILTEHFSPNATFSLLDAVHLMIVYSDNTATNLVLDQIGIASTAETMEKLGYPHTKIHSKVYRRDTSVFPERSKQFGLGSTTAGEMVRLFEALHRQQLVGPDACAAMRRHLLACDDKEKFPRFLPPGTKVAFKTGSVDAARTAAGIIETPGGPVALCVMTATNEDQRWVADNAGNRLCADVAREVFGYYQAKSPTAGKLGDRG
jgi:beta-lactamase class A